MIDLLKIKTGYTIKYREPVHPRLYTEEDKKKYRSQFLKETFNLSHGEGIRKKKRRRKK